MLQVVQCAAIGHGNHHGPKLQRGHRDALAIGAQLSYAAISHSRGNCRKLSQVLAFDVIAGQFAHAKHVSVAADADEAKFASQGLKISVIRVRQSIGQVHVRAASELELHVFSDQAFFQPRERDCNLEGRARLRSFRKGELLVHHGENAS